MHEIELDYATKFWEAYPDVRKFMRLHISDAHENTGEIIKYADDHLLKFIYNFHTKGYLKDTQIIIIADHGEHFFVRHLPIIPDDSRQQGIQTPLLIHLAPKSIPFNIAENLAYNQQRFINSHDIYATLKSFATGKSADSPAIESLSCMFLASLLALKFIISIQSILFKKYGIFYL